MLHRQRAGILAKPCHLPCQKSDSKKGSYMCDGKALGDGWCWAIDCSIMSRKWHPRQKLPWPLGEGGHPVWTCSPVLEGADWQPAHGAHSDVVSRHRQLLLHAKYILRIWSLGTARSHRLLGKLLIDVVAISPHY